MAIKDVMPVKVTGLRHNFGLPKTPYSLPSIFSMFWAMLVALHDFAVHNAAPVEAYLPEAMLLTANPFLNVLIAFSIVAVSWYAASRGATELKKRRMAAKMASLVGVAPEYQTETVTKGEMHFEPAGTKFPQGPYMLIRHNGEILRVPALPPSGRKRTNQEILAAYEQLEKFCSDATPPTASGAKESILPASPLTMTGNHSKGVVTIYATAVTGERKVFGLGSRVKVQRHGEEYTVLLTCTHVLDQIRNSNATDPGIEHTTKAGFSRCFPREGGEHVSLFNWVVYTTSPQNQHDITMLIAPGPNRGQAVWQNMEVAPLALGALKKRAIVSLNGQMPSGAKYTSEGIVVKATAGQLWHTSSTTPTTSGTPLMNKGAVVGVHAASGSSQDGDFNVARSIQIFTHATRTKYSKESWHAENYEEQYYQQLEEEEARQYEWDGMMKGSTRHHLNHYTDDFEDGNELPWGDREDDEDLHWGDMERAYKLTHDCAHGTDCTKESTGCSLCALAQTTAASAKITTQLKKAEKRGSNLLAARDFYNRFDRDQEIIAEYAAAAADPQSTSVAPDVSAYVSKPDRAKAYAHALAEEDKKLAQVLAEQMQDIPTDDEIKADTERADAHFGALLDKFMKFTAKHEADHAGAPPVPKKPDPLIEMSDKTTKLEAKMLAVMEKLQQSDTDRDTLRRAIRDVDAEAKASADARKEALLKAAATVAAVEQSARKQPATAGQPTYADDASDLASLASGFFDEKKESVQDFRSGEPAAGSKTPMTRMRELIEAHKKAEKPTKNSWTKFAKLRKEILKAPDTMKKDSDFLSTISKPTWMRTSTSTTGGGQSAGVSQKSSTTA